MPVRFPPSAFIPFFRPSTHSLRTTAATHPRRTPPTLFSQNAIQSHSSSGTPLPLPLPFLALLSLINIYTRRRSLDCWMPATPLHIGPRPIHASFASFLVSFSLHGSFHAKMWEPVMVTP